MKPLTRLPARNKRAPLTRSQMMSRIRSRDTRPERVTSAAIRALGIRFRRHVINLPGKPDFANRRRKWAVFVHGCFWHSHKSCKLASRPKTNQNYWTNKLLSNRKRDRAKSALLRDMGFRVLIIWECETRTEKVLRSQLTRFFKEIQNENNLKIT